jgi:hypothetical protein
MELPSRRFVWNTTVAPPTLAWWKRGWDLLVDPPSHLAIVGLIHTQRQVAGVEQAQQQREKQNGTR